MVEPPLFSALPGLVSSGLHGTHAAEASSTLPSAAGPTRPAAQGLPTAVEPTPVSAFTGLVSSGLYGALAAATRTSSSASPSPAHGARCASLNPLSPPPPAR